MDKWNEKILEEGPCSPKKTIIFIEMIHPLLVSIAELPENHYKDGLELFQDHCNKCFGVADDYTEFI